jgi:hypothetical protein
MATRNPRHQVQEDSLMPLSLTQVSQFDRSPKALPRLEFPSFMRP